MAEQDEHKVMRSIARPLLDVIGKSLRDIESQLYKNKDVEKRLLPYVKDALAKLERAMKGEEAEDKEEENEKTQEEHAIDEIIGMLQKLRELFEKHSGRLREIYELDEIERKAFSDIRDDLKRFKKMETTVDVVINGNKVNAVRGNFLHMEKNDPEKALKIKEGFIEKIISRLEHDINNLVATHKKTNERVLARLKAVFGQLKAEEHEFSDLGHMINSFCEQMSKSHAGMAPFLNKLRQELGIDIAHHFKNIETQTMNIEGYEKLINNITNDTIHRINALLEKANKLNAQDFETSRAVYEHSIVKETDQLVEHINKYVEDLRARGEVNRGLTLYQICDRIKVASENTKTVAEEIKDYSEEWKKYMKALKSGNFHFNKT